MPTSYVTPVRNGGPRKYLKKGSQPIILSLLERYDCAETPQERRELRAQLRALGYTWADADTPCPRRRTTV